MFCERKRVGGSVAEKGDAAPSHERDDDSITSKKAKTDLVGGGLEAIGTGVDGINALGWGMVQNDKKRVEM